VEARADDVQLGLREGALHAEHETVVELGRIAAAILVDHERTGDGAQLEEAVPVLVRARQARRFQGEDRADLAHRHLADQRFEVLAMGHPRAGLAEIAVEDPNALRAPAELLGLALQIVLPLRALLIEANLPRRRLANVDAGIPRQVSLGDLR
jgi:hypothetical protein